MSSWSLMLAREGSHYSLAPTEVLFGAAFLESLSGPQESAESITPLSPHPGKNRA
jgi:hypothetical protein